MADAGKKIIFNICRTSQAHSLLTTAHAVPACAEIYPIKQSN
jgi:hypothetical protein